MACIGGGWEESGVGSWGGWAARGRLYLPQGHRQQCCETVVGSSLVPHMSFLMSPIGSTGHVVHIHGFKG